MIVVERMAGGVSVQIAHDPNDPAEILEEFTALIGSMHKYFTDHTHSKELADSFIAFAGRMAFAETDEEKDKIADELCELMEKDVKERFGKIIDEVLN